MDTLEASLEGLPHDDAFRSREGAATLHGH